MDWNVLRELLQTLGTAGALLLGGTQLWDRRRNQATRVTASKQRVNGSCHAIVRNPSEAPIRAVLLVCSDGEDPPMLTWFGWDEIPAGAEAAVDLEERFAQTFGWVLPLAPCSAHGGGSVQ